MKKFIAIMLIFAICCGLGIYFYMDHMQQKTVEELVLPTVPQIAVPTLPAREDSGETAEEATGEAAEPTDPTGETYPWEAEFDEEDYAIDSGFSGQNKITSYHVGTIFGRRVRRVDEYANGKVEDTYY